MREFKHVQIRAGLFLQVMRQRHAVEMTFLNFQMNTNIASALIKVQ